jgi:putative two-component system response regulator
MHMHQRTGHAHIETVSTARPSPKVLVVDDSEDTRQVLTELLQQEGYVVRAAADGAAALAVIERDPPDVVLTDVAMPHVDGFELCGRLKSDPATRLIPVVLVTGLRDRADRLTGITVGADDFLMKPFDSAELLARVASLLRLKRVTDDLDYAESVILTLALTVEAREPYTSGHCRRMAYFAAGFGMHLGLDDEQIAALRRGGYLHDVGKIAVPEAIVSKPGPLTNDEFAVMKRHPVVGETLCGQLRMLRAVRPIVRSHHERLDGTGYPDCLHGDDVPLLAQMMAIVDVYDAVTSDRPYRSAQEDTVAHAELIRDAERGWRDRALVQEFVDISRSGRLKQLADLSTEMCPTRKAMASITEVDSRP